MDNRPDRQLIADYLKGDEKSLEILIKRYLRPIYGFVCRYVGNSGDAEDITQDIFIKVWRNLKKFNPKKNLAPYRTDSASVATSAKEAGSGSGFKTWIFSIAKNTCIDFHRKKKAIPFSRFEDEKGENILTKTLFSSAPLPDELSERRSVAQILQSAVEKLLPKYRLVLSLRYSDNLNFREIAERLKEPLDTVKSRHRRALIILKKLLES